MENKGFSFRIRFGDTDPFGVAYYVSYFRYANQAVEDFLCRLMGKPAAQVWKDNKEGYGLPVVEAIGKFIKPVRYGDEVDVYVRIDNRTEKRVQFICSFVKRGELVAEVEMVCVAIDADWNPRTLPAEFRE
jgi:acyl-CoA thioester hydrolase